MTGHIEVSCVVPFEGRFDDSGALIQEYLVALEATGKSFELVCVIDDRHVHLREKLLETAEKNTRLRIIQLARSFGEAASLSAGFESTTGEIVLTLPAYYQIESGEIHKLIAGLDSADVVIGARWPRVNSSKFELIRRKFFHWLVGRVIGHSFKDLGCSARALKRTVVDEVPLYGDQHRFLPLLAIRRGFRVREVQVSQSAMDINESGYSSRVYVRHVLDILTVFFLVRFTKRPLRFFGTIGSIMFSVGAIFLSYVIFERVFFDVALADRPALLLSSLFVVLGLQVFALGLLGELIIFTNAKDIKEYTIEKVIN
jgi:glycosyltransferase involved in cell wall biosynthesis